MSCMYCGSSGQAGYMCTKSPTRKHVSPVEGKCSYCGSSGKAGYGCTLSPIRTHVVLKYGRCSFCDSSSKPGGNCPKSPSKRHVHVGGHSLTVHTGIPPYHSTVGLTFPQIGDLKHCRYLRKRALCKKIYIQQALNNFLISICSCNDNLLYFVH